MWKSLPYSGCIRRSLHYRSIDYVNSAFTFYFPRLSHTPQLSEPQRYSSDPGLEKSIWRQDLCIKFIWKMSGTMVEVDFITATIFWRHESEPFSKPWHFHLSETGKKFLLWRCLGHTDARYYGWMSEHIPMCLRPLTPVFEFSRWLAAATLFPHRTLCKSYEYFFSSDNSLDMN